VQGRIFGVVVSRYCIFLTHCVREGVCKINQINQYLVKIHGEDTGRPVVLYTVCCLLLLNHSVGLRYVAAVKNGHSKTVTVTVMSGLQAM